MKNAVRAFVLGLAAALADAACTSSCLRNTDCGSGEACVSGTCVVVAVADGSTVDAMTARPSSTPTPTATNTAPTPSGTAPPPDAEAPPLDAWTATPEAGYTVPDGF